MSTEPQIIFRTPAPGCPACAAKRIHTEPEWDHHPLRGHGYVAEHGWTHPELAKEVKA